MKRLKVSLFKGAIATVWFLMTLPVCAQVSGVSRAPASAATAIVDITSPSKYFSRDNMMSPDLVSTYYKLKQEETAPKVTDWVPMDLKPTESQTKVASQIADRSLNTYINSPEVRATFIGQTATKVEKSLRQDVDLGKSDEIQHKLQFNVQAFQSTAMLHYSGYTDADLKYQAAASTVSLSFKVIDNKKLIFSHQNSVDMSSVANTDGTVRTESVNRVSLGWNF